jgi:magnesium transporter
MTVGRSDRLSCAENDDLTTEFWEVFIVDPQAPPGGYVPAEHGYCARRATYGLSDVMKRNQTLIPVAIWIRKRWRYAFRNTRLFRRLSPMKAGRLIGVITVG